MGKKKKSKKKKKNRKRKKETYLEKMARRWRKLKKSTKERYGSFANYVKAMSR